MDEIARKQLGNLIYECLLIKKAEKNRKQKKSEYNKRYYQKHKDEILSKQREMRNIYRIVKQN